MTPSPSPFRRFRPLPAAVALLLLTSASPAQVRVTFDDAVAETDGGPDAAARVVGAHRFVEGVAGRAIEFPSEDEGPAFARVAHDVPFAAERDASVVVWVRTRAAGDGFPALVSNKDWMSGEVLRDTSRSDFGVSRTSGIHPGWVLALQPGGAWCFNIGDGEWRRDYRPTARHQPVADGDWHQLAFVVRRASASIRLYRDGVNVAIYDITGMGSFDSGLDTCLGADGLGAAAAGGGAAGAGRGAAGAYDELEILPVALTDAEIASRFAAVRPDVGAPRAPSEPVDELRVLTWNIWNGGRHDGEEAGLSRTVQAIRDSGADVVCVQETYGSGPAIADGLGFHLYQRSPNLAVLSRHPFVEVEPLHFPFYLAGAMIDLGAGRRARVFSMWLNHEPDFAKGAARPGVTPDELIKAEGATRRAMIRSMLSQLRSALRDTAEVPLILAGDFNSPSHLDWTAATAGRHHGLVVEWPVSAKLAKTGFTDAFRAVHPDPVADPGPTWPTRFTDAASERIDRIYVCGRGVRVIDAEVRDHVEPRWPSDHAAVLATLRWGGGAKDR